MNIKWNMEKLICGVALFICVANLWADDTYHDPASYIETKTIHGFSIGVTDDYGLTNNTPTDRHLCFTVWSNNKIWFTNNIDDAIFPTQPEYAYQGDLFDTNGVAMPKTELGEKVGSHFMDFGFNSYGEGVKTQRIMTVRKGQLSGLLEIFRPSDFFVIKNAGHYTLRISFQIIAFPRTGPNRGDYTNYLIRFPPLNYPLVKK
jgi:hypothetical protein